ncbi:MAG: hypothetical protein OXH14_00855 [Alphaproteobacteria bacterium]|nr:hypothetical protein [Alphaproteobacteria bacterium]
MTGREETVPDAERRRAANAALTSSIEEVCRHYAPSGSRVEDCWEVRGETGAVSLRVFLAGPMQGSWTDAATGGRGDALDLVAHLRGLDAARALAEAERFLDQENAGPERNAGDAGDGQMGLFETLPEGRRRKRAARQSGKGRKAGASRPAARPHEPPADAASPCPGDNPAGAGDETGHSRNAAAAPEDGKAEPGPMDPAQDARTGSGESGPPATDAAGVSFSADDRQRIRKTAEDVAWLRSRQAVRSLDARAHERAKARKNEQGRRRRRTGLKAAVILALAVFGPVLGVMGEYRYGVVDFASVLGAELPEGGLVLPDGGG